MGNKQYMQNRISVSKRKEWSAQIKAKASELGFGACGLARASFLETEAVALENWLRNGWHGQMAYMANHFDLRVDPRKLVDGAKSVISLLYNYFAPLQKSESQTAQISIYALGEDYHFILKRKLASLLQFIQESIGPVSGRGFVDSAPVLERAWAVRCGLGWIGKNGLLLNRHLGSFVFLAELIIDLELAYDQPGMDYCGNCTRCIQACPTGAIIAPRLVDASRCISYLTIELKGEIPREMIGKFQNRIFGCDICQQVCPWNRFARPHQEKNFAPHPELLTMTLRDWQELSREQFHKLFRRSAVKRTGYEGLIRNIRFARLSENSGE